LGSCGEESFSFGELRGLLRSDDLDFMCSLRLFQRIWAIFPSVESLVRTIRYGRNDHIYTLLYPIG
jgi:hypothetical protein